MVPTTGYVSLFAKLIRDKIDEVTGSYVDDTLSAGTRELEVESRTTERKFKSSARIFDDVIFVGIQIEKNRCGYRMHQARYITKMENIPRSADFEIFRSMCHKLAWLGHTRPDLMAPVNLLSQISEKVFKADHIRLINQVVDRSHAGDERGLIEWNLRKNSLKMIVFTDSSFANNRDLSTQLGLSFCSQTIRAGRKSCISRVRSLKEWLDRC